MRITFNTPRRRPFFACLCRDGGAVDSGCDDPNVGRRRDLRPRRRHDSRFVCFRHRRHTGFPRFAVAAARLGADEIRRSSCAGQCRHRKEGAFYLFALRLVPLFPFFVVNLVMGLTKIRTWTFYWVSQLSMLAGTIVYVYAGTKLGEFRISAGC